LSLSRRKLINQGVVLFGGSFDPFHLGHATVIHKVLRLPFVTKVIIIPSFIPPHKPLPSSSSQDRLAMLRLWAKNRPRIKISDWEITKNHVSWTIDAVRYFLSKAPKTPMFLCLGNDNYFELHRWKEYKKLLAMINIMVINRSLQEKKEYLQYYQTHLQQHIPWEHIHFVFMSPVLISSSEIREQIKKGLDISHWVPKTISDYIHKKGLYKTS